MMKYLIKNKNTFATNLVAVVLDKSCGNWRILDIQQGHLWEEKFATSDNAIAHLNTISEDCTVTLLPKF